MARRKGLWTGTLLLLTLAMVHSAQSQLPGNPAAQGPVTPDAGPTPPASPQTPFWVPLPPQHEQYVNDILRFWQQRSSGIERYRASFRRWEYDPVFGPSDTFKTYSEGLIQYAAPDKGMFKVTTSWVYRPPAEPGAEPTYDQLEGVQEHWICDGQSIFEKDYRRKRLVVRELPPEMRGASISRGPIPFLFGANADDLRSRFWIRVITPEDTEGEYWLEAVPKTWEDAANYRMVHVILAEEDYLPKGLVIFERNAAEGAQPGQTTYQFDRREENFFDPNQLNIFRREFYEPSIDRDWERVDYQYVPPENAGARVPPPGAPARR